MRKSYIVLMSVVALLGTTNVAHAGGNDDSDKPTLMQIEDKLFAHDYGQEDEDTRLSRIEKFIFGGAQTGSEKDRLANIQNALAESKEEENELSPVAKAQPVQDNRSAQNTQQTAPEADEEDQPQVNSKQMFDYSTYPKVTQLEHELLGKTYVSESITDRLSRLEIKAFGQTSADKDLSTRTDQLITYAERHDLYNEHGSGASNTALQSFSSSQTLMPYTPASYSAVGDDNAPPPPPNWQATSVDQRIAVMEQTVFGHASSKPVTERIQRLEKRLVPYEHNLAQKNLSARVDNLWTIVSAANNLNNPITANHANKDSIIAMSGTGNGANNAPDSDSQNDQTNTSNTTQKGTHQSWWLHNMSKIINSTGALPQTGTPGYPTIGPEGSTTYWLP